MYRLALLCALFLNATIVCMQNDATDIFLFQPLTKNDLPLLFKWFAQPYIAQLWKEPQDWRLFEEKFTDRLSSQETFSFIAYLKTSPIGYIQYHKVNTEDRALFPDLVLPSGSVGLDLFIGEPSYLNKGYGTQLLTSFINYVLKREPTCTTIIIDPAPDNYRAIACYQKVGFTIKGTYMTPYGPTGSGPGNIVLMIYKK